jgi:hypothetical protein
MRDFSVIVSQLMSAAPELHDGRTCLTIWQPWAWLICAGIKDVENRSWPTPYTGWLYIHAGLKYDEDASEYIRTVAPHIAVPPADDLKYGGIIGRVKMIGCSKAARSKWANPRSYHWQLQGGEPLPFERLSGKQGLFQAGDRKRVLELPHGFVIRTDQIKSGHWRARLYRGSARIGAVLTPAGVFLHEDRDDVNELAAAKAHELADLPGLESIHAPECGCEPQQSELFSGL